MGEDSNGSKSIQLSILNIEKQLSKSINDEDFIVYILEDLQK